MNDKIKVVIVDDNEIFSYSLENLLIAGFNNLEIIGKANSVKHAIEVIRDTKPNLVFLDIDLPDGTGFDVLTELNDKNFEIIFTTAHQSFAYKSYEYSALYYLLKSEICHATLLKAIVQYKNPRRRTEIILENNDSKNNILNNIERIVIHTEEGQNIFDIKDIYYCEAKGNCCTIYFESFKEVSSRNLNFYYDTLQNKNFARIHNKYIVNLKHIKRINSSRKQITLSNDKELVISRSFKEKFLDKFNHLTIFS